MSVELAGVPPDPDQLPILNCMFPDCRVSCDARLLYLVVYRGKISSVCGNCLRTKIPKTDQ